MAVSVNAQPTLAGIPVRSGSRPLTGGKHYDDQAQIVVRGNSGIKHADHNQTIET